MNFFIIKILLFSTIAFVLTMILTPALTRFLYKYKLGKGIRDQDQAPVFASMHAKKAGTPVMGGILVWGTTLILILTFFYLSEWFGGVFSELNFLSRSETFLPLGALIASAIVGLIDDVVDVKRVGHKGGGLRMRHRFLMYFIIACVGAWWFYTKLDWTVLHIPFYGNIEIGWWYIPVFIFVIISTAFSVNEIDGLDGLAGGSLVFAYVAFGAIAFSLGRYDLATFCAVIVGGLLAFLWFNIHPARFFMGDTGSMSLGITLGIIAMLTNSALFLPVIGFILVVDTMSVIVQVASKKIFKRKVFISAPFHHHLEAIGWPETKIVMRFWVIAGLSAGVGLMLFLMDKSGYGF